MTTTYSQAGVNIDNAEKFVQHIKRSVKSTYTKGVLNEIGLFGAFFDARFKNYKSPVLVSSVDGVGTKLLVAQMTNRHDTIGSDLVNHCVNDILVCGARPLFFLDYFATGRLRLDIAEAVIRGFSEACRENGCALIGGETAEMPGMYEEHSYDLSGTIVGVVEKKDILDGKKVRKGDVLIGLPSSGLHTNGYSLARAVLFKRFQVDDYIEELGQTLADSLLAIHRSYLHIIQPLLKGYGIHGLSHITGGGIVGNTMRIVPKGRSLRIDWGAWARPPIFSLIQRVGDVPEEDMRRTFNLGIGLVIIVGRQQANGLMRRLRKLGENPTVMGEVV